MKKFILTITLLFSSAAFGQCVYPCVQEAHNFTGVTGQPVLTTGTAVSKGDLLISWVESTSPTYQLISDSANIDGQKPIVVKQQMWSGSTTYLSVWYAVAQRTGVLGVKFIDQTVPVNGGSAPVNLTDPICQILEFVGFSSTPLDVSSLANNPATGTGTAAILSVPAAGANELIWAVPSANGQTTSANAGWIDPTSGSGYSSAYAVKSSSGTYTPTFTVAAAAAWGVVGAAFRPAATPYTISGALGASGAGATVLFQSVTTNYHFSVTANGSGHYTSPGLPADSYFVQPQLVGQVFTPQTATVAVASNSTQNFVAASVNTTLTLTNTIADNFNRANENPLSLGSYWHSNGGGVPPWDYPLAIVSNAAVVSNAAIVANYAGPWSGDGVDVWTGPTDANGYTNQNSYVQVDIAVLNPASPAWGKAQLCLRSNTNNSVSVYMWVFNQGDGTVFARVVGINSSSAFIPAIEPEFITLYGVPFTSGDSFGLAAVGYVYYVMHNGVVIGNYYDSNTYASPAYLSIGMTGTAQTDVEFTNFVGGNAAGVSSAGAPPVNLLGIVR